MWWKFKDELCFFDKFKCQCSHLYELLLFSVHQISVKYKTDIVRFETMYIVWLNTKVMDSYCTYENHIILIGITKIEISSELTWPLRTGGIRVS